MGKDGEITDGPCAMKLAGTQLQPHQRPFSAISVALQQRPAFLSTVLINCQPVLEWVVGYTSHPNVDIHEIEVVLGAIADRGKEVLGPIPQGPDLTCSGLDSAVFDGGRDLFTQNRRTGVMRQVDHQIVVGIKGWEIPKSSHQRGVSFNLGLGLAIEAMRNTDKAIHQGSVLNQTH